MQCTIPVQYTHYSYQCTVQYDNNGGGGGRGVVEVGVLYHRRVFNCIRTGYGGFQVETMFQAYLVNLISV